MWGFTEGLTWMKHAPPPIQVDEEDPAKSMIESWEWDRNANTLTWVIKTGIPFHNPDFGEVDAEDVAFSFNEAISQGSTFNRAGQLRSWIGTIEAVDKRTVLVECREFGCQEDWIKQQSNYNGQTASLTSLDAFEQLGEEDSLGNLDNMTGAFRATRWITNEVIEAESVRPHWRWEPLVDTLKFVEIPQNSVRMAAFINGEIHLADLPPKFVAQAVDESGGRAQQIGGGRALYTRAITGPRPITSARQAKATTLPCARVIGRTKPTRGSVNGATTSLWIVPARSGRPCP